jgi:hypothetical protein
MRRTPMKHTTALLLLSLTLAACRAEPEAKKTVKPPPEKLSFGISGPKSALLSIRALLPRSITRPGAPLGLFTTLYLAQGSFLPAPTALQGIRVLESLTQQSERETDSSYALLQELGNVLQVNLIDMLNRSQNRPEALTTYTRVLQELGTLSTEHTRELAATRDTHKQEQRDIRNRVSQLKRQIERARWEKDYTEAGQVQEDLAMGQARLSELETKLDQLEGIIDTFEELLSVAEERLQAIEKNREVLIAGLKVIEVPGIEGLGILEEGERRRRTRGGTRFDSLRSL